MELMEIIRAAAQKQGQASVPADLVTGKVTAIDPLVITVDQKLPISEEFLILTNECRDYEVEVTVDWNTGTRAGGTGEMAFSAHDHDLKGTTRLTVHNALAEGDTVVMVRKRGGQRYLVIGKGKAE